MFNFILGWLRSSPWSAMLPGMLGKLARMGIIPLIAISCSHTQSNTDFGCRVEADYTNRHWQVSVGEDRRPAYFVAGLESGYWPFQTVIGEGDRSHTVISGPPGLVLTDGAPLVWWKPPESAMGKTFTVKTLSKIDNLCFHNTFSIEVLSTRLVKGEKPTPESFLVADKGSTLQDYLFVFPDEQPLVFELREVDLHAMPKPTGTQFISSGFYSLSDVPVDLYIPIGRLTDRKRALRSGYYAWQSWQDETWWKSSFSTHLVTLNNISYIKYKLASTAQLGVIARKHDIYF